MLAAFLWGGLASAALLVGYLLAERGLSNRTIGLIMGVRRGRRRLVARSQYELVPDSLNGGWEIALFTLLRGFDLFRRRDWVVDRRGRGEGKDHRRRARGSGAAVFIGTLLDNIPESIVLGMGLALGGSIRWRSWWPSWSRTCRKEWQAPST